MPRVLLAALLTLAVAAGCADRPAQADGKLNVVTAFYPLQFLSERIGGDTVAVTNLTKPGAEPHDVELNPRQVADVADAGLAVYLSGFQPAVDAAIAQEAKDRSFDVASVVELLPYTEKTEESEGGDRDPHVWLDPVRFSTIAGALGEKMAAADPAHAAAYRSAAAELQTQLQDLNKEYAKSLASCQRHELVTSHSAFNYLATRYGLTQVGITGISPEAEPSPQRLAAVAEQARATGSTTIFFETLVSPKVAETIAREVGARTAVLDPLEGLTDTTSDYFTVMRANLAALTEALGCTS
ncbi:metal ABC transporter substrate-binding protein [Paractinoplanes toevensis]|uniref:Zinc ABC transporter substrate-binding protein n=1 Tax=Paractinoplanes toevensis TaxID=571911 RepID=A0A919W3D8_9ACTN|nr:zinc ABC transporter substrate-binding protein [Actinoplanes toevensis]GIM88998.1 zinc ABC transporter substrate-binding protein [Actinoplanes toevensis]